MKNINFLLACLFSSFVVHLQAHAGSEVDNRVWLNINAQGPLPFEKFAWYAELQPRAREEGEALDQLLARVAVLYKLTPQSSVWLGYGKIRTHGAKTGIVDENRIWQQYSHNFKILDDVGLLSRTRIEQRQLENGDDIGYRVRQMIRLTRPFESDPNFSTVVSNEIFFNMNDTDWGARSGFDQNRLFGGLGYAISPMVRVEAGYLNQYVDTATVNRMNHVLSLSMSLNF